MRCFAIISALSLVRADLVVDLEALAEGSFKDVEALKAIQWNPHCTGNFTCADPYEAYRGMPSLTMMSESRAYVRVGGDDQPFGALYSSTEEEHVQAIFVKDGEGKVIHFVRIAVGQQPITEFDVPEEPPAEMTAYAITYTRKTGQTALWQGASLELADIDDDIADANGEIDPDRIPEAPQPECPTGGCARDRAKAEAAKEEL